jgi:hypothetical protein
MNWHCFLFGHSSDWTRVIVNGVWFRQCDRCQQPTTALLVNSEAEGIQPAKVPAVRERKAVKAKKTRKPKMTRPTLKVVG